MRRLILGLAGALALTGCVAPPEPPDRPAFRLRPTFDWGHDLVQHTRPGAGGDVDPALSPDGLHLAFASRRDGPRANLYVMSLEHPRVWRVTATQSDDRYPDFSPDGQWLAFASNRDGNWDIWLARSLRGGQLRQLTTTADDEVRPTWAPDGKRLAYSTKNRHGAWSIWIWEIETDRHILVGPGLFPSWSPDGKQIVFQKVHPTRGGWATLWVYDFETRTGSELYANHDMATLAPSWSPGGSHIAFAVRPVGSDDWWSTRATSLWVVNSDGGNPRTLHSSGETLGAPVWAFDGRIFFPTTRRGFLGVWSLRLRETADGEAS